MKFKSSPKNFENYKNTNPKITLLKIFKYLQDLNFEGKIKYSEIALKINNSEKVFFGNIYLNYPLKDLTSGKGVSSNLCKTSAFAEFIERLLSNSLSIEGNNKMKEYPKKAFSILNGKYIKINNSFIGNNSGSNGLAAGNTLEEAVSQGFCEVCERFAAKEYLLKKKPANTVKKNTIKNKKIQDFINFFESLNFEIKIKDMTFEGEIPVMGVVFINNNLKNNKSELVKKKFYKQIFVGSHFDLEEAIIRCFTEMIQIFQGSKDRIKYPHNYSIRKDYHHNDNLHYVPDILDKIFTKEEIKKIINNFKSEKNIESFFINLSSFENFNFLDKNEKIICFYDLKSIKTNDFFEDIKLIKKVGKRKKWDINIINYTSKDSPLYIIRVFIPYVSTIASNFNYYTITLKDFNGMNDRDKFKFLKFYILPEVLLEFQPFSFKDTFFDVPKIINIMKELSQKSNNQKETNKINKIEKELSDNSFVKGKKGKKQSIYDIAFSIHLEDDLYNKYKIEIDSILEKFKKGYKNFKVNEKKIKEILRKLREIEKEFDKIKNNSKNEFEDFIKKVNNLLEYKELLEKDKGEIYNKLGIIYSKKGENKKALKYINKGLKYNFNNKDYKELLKIIKKNI